jgi:hypothetical protein
MRQEHRPLNNAAMRHFRNWGNALRAAGIDPEKISGRRTWTLERIATRIRQLDQEGIPLYYGSVYRHDSGLPQAAMKLLGSWDAALRFAGYDPEIVRKRRRPYTRDEIIALIRRRAARGLPIASYTVVPASAEVASRKLFGSWKAALRAAGVPNPSTEFPVWTKVSVVEGILIRQSQGEAMHCAAAAHQASRLYDAARRHFGTWKAALKAAGIDPATVRRKRRPYTREEIIEHIKRQCERGEPYERALDNPESIVRAARRLFGRWSAALQAAGINLR